MGGYLNIIYLLLISTYFYLLVLIVAAKLLIFFCSTKFIFPCRDFVVSLQSKYRTDYDYRTTNFQPDSVASAGNVQTLRDGQNDG